MSQEKRTEISSIGEFGLIERLTRDWPLFQASTYRAAGDDAAVIHASDETIVVTTDMMIEGIHFDLAYHPLRHLGYKSIIVNLSDVCAMNAIPQQVLVSIGISNRFSVEAVEELYTGIRAACETYGVDLVGGDTCSSGKGLILSVTAIGQAPRDQLVYRNGAKPGDIVCITGDLGAAYLGLQLLEREKQIYMAHPETQPDLEGEDYIISRQLRPEARKDMISVFREYDFRPSAMIDISDGLSSDLTHICKASGTGARIDEATVPFTDDVQQMALKFQLDPITCALHGGEDYELLFTADPSDLEKVRVMPGIYIIGEILEEKEGIMLKTSGGQTHALKAQGWGHF